MRSSFWGVGLWTENVFHLISAATEKLPTATQPAKTLPFFDFLCCVHMPRWFSGVLVFFALWLTGCESVKPIAKQNLAYQYNTSFPFEVKARILESGEELNVFLQLSFKKLSGLQNPQQIWDKYQMRYHITTGYDGRKILTKDTLGIDHRMSPSVNPLVLFIKLPKSEQDRLLLLEIREKNTTESHVFDFPIREERFAGNFESCLFNKAGRLPVFQNFIQAGDTVVMRKFSFQDEKLELEFHPFNSSVALPPMAAVATSGHDFDKFYPVHVTANQPTVFKEAGYYFLPSAKGNGQGFGFTVVPAYYPSVTLPMELIDPMIYISTREERKNLLEASNQKMALDQFWLKIHSQKNAARKLIKNYFENIETANYLFTSHKAGWKTDQGMVMAIYGPPPVVYRTWDMEIWQYDKTPNTENTIFYFGWKPAEKNPNVWEMRRFNEYDRIWYGVVELWRKGVISR